MTQNNVINLLKTVSGVVVLLTVTACANIKLPSLDILKLPEFKEESENIGDYPSVQNAPSLPTEVKSSKEWDAQAKKILKIRDKFNSPVEPDRPITEDEILQEIDRLTDSVNEYRNDDPPQ